MQTQQLRESLKNEPFRPFRMHLADGRSLRVVHPEQVSVSPGGRTAVVWLGDESSQIVDVMLVTSLEFEDNGRMEKTG